MLKLIVMLPEDRRFAGTLRIEGKDGDVLAGPFPVCARADESAARRHDNPKRHPLLPFGDTPLGRYRVVGVLPSAGADMPADRFGPHGVIVLRPIAGDAALADANGRFRFLIQGGELGPGRRLRPTNGALRLADCDQKRLVRILRKAGGGVCDCVPIAESVATRKPVAQRGGCEEDDPPRVESLVAGLARQSGTGEGDRSDADDTSPVMRRLRRRFAPPKFNLSSDDGSGGGGGGGGGDGGGYSGDDDLEDTQNSDTDPTYPSQIPPQCTAALDIDVTEVRLGSSDLSRFVYHSQQPKGPNYVAGSDCKSSCDAMVKSTGVKAVQGPGDLFLISEQATKTGGLKDPDPQAASQAVSYIDDQLRQGNPVEVGVCYDPAKHQKDGRIAGHYVVIYGKKEEAGNTYYVFRDPGTANEKRSYGVFQTNNNILTGNSPYNARTYGVSEVRKNSK